MPLDSATVLSKTRLGLFERDQGFQLLDHGVSGIRGDQMRIQLTSCTYEQGPASDFEGPSSVASRRASSSSPSLARSMAGPQDKAWILSMSWATLHLETTKLLVVAVSLCVETELHVPHPFCDSSLGSHSYPQPVCPKLRPRDLSEHQEPHAASCINRGHQSLSSRPPLAPQSPCNAFAHRGLAHSRRADKTSLGAPRDSYELRGPVLNNKYWYSCRLLVSPPPPAPPRSNPPYIPGPCRWL